MTRPAPNPRHPSLHLAVRVQRGAGASPLEEVAHGFGADCDGDCGDGQQDEGESGSGETVGWDRVEHDPGDCRAEAGAGELGAEVHEVVVETLRDAVAQGAPDCDGESEEHESEDAGDDVGQWVGRQPLEGAGGVSTALCGHGEGCVEHPDGDGQDEDVDCLEDAGESVLGSIVGVHGKYLSLSR